MKILFGYDYIDSLGYIPCRIRVKCRLILTDEELDDYLKTIRKHFNPLNMNCDDVIKRKIIKIKDYHKQLINCEYDNDLDIEKE